MKNFLVAITIIFFAMFATTTFVIGKARMAMQIENEKRFCEDRGFSDIQVCREWWITSGEYKKTN